MSNLKLKLKKVDPVKYGLIMGITMALLTFVMLLVAFLFTSLIGIGLGGASYGALGLLGGGIASVIIAPIIYFIVGFIFGWLGTIILNLILNKTDGLDIEFEKVGLDIDRIGAE